VLLYLVRHAEAASGEPDELRPLTPAGREAARAVGRQLAGEGLEAVLTSPLLRARETADAIAKASGLEAEADERLAQGATVDDVRAAVAGRGERVAVVGHQPDCSLIATAVSGVDPGFPPGGAVRLDLGA
jgi:phosphohistidine phosphatase SixA